MSEAKQKAWKTAYNEALRSASAPEGTTFVILVQTQLSQRYSIYHSGANYSAITSLYGDVVRDRPLDGFAMGLLPVAEAAGPVTDKTAGAAKRRYDAWKAAVAERTRVAVGA